MLLSRRIKAFAAMGQQINALTDADLSILADEAARENPWFTQSNVRMALEGVSLFLSEEKLTRWTSTYSLDNRPVRTVGVAMAGNIPLVGFHDFLCVLIAGHRLKAKLSSQDRVLITFFRNLLIKIAPAFENLILLEERLNNVDAIIATGGNNTARYFEYYFRNVPHIIRRNRSSCAILSGAETKSDFEALAIDVFSYFGLGCRNISKLYVPENYNFHPLLLCWESHKEIMTHHKYFNNYDYQKSILLVNKIPFYDNGMVLLKEDNAFVSPISILFYEFYTDTQDLQKKIAAHAEKIQCIVSANKQFPGSEKFGKAQYPEAWDYADGVDTLKFLEQV